MSLDEVHAPYCSSWKQLSTIIIDAMLTHGWHFQLHCCFQLVLVDYHGFHSQIVNFNCK
jgi:hypothetical protein